MTFPKTIDEFIDSYKFVDRKEVYTNGSELIQVFRVKQAIERYLPKWISVKERLPKEWKPVLGMVAIAECPTNPIIDSMVYIGNIAGEDKWRVCWNHDMVESAVTHWMPFPGVEE